MLVSPLTFLSNPKSLALIIKDSIAEISNLIKLQLKLFSISAKYRLRPYLFPETISAFGKLNLVFTFRHFQPFQSLYPAPKFVFVSDFSVQNVEEIDFNFDHNRKKIYVSLGTLYNKDFELLERIVGVLKEFFNNMQIIVACGNDENLQRLSDLPANFVVRKYVAQTKVLDSVDLIIASGGMNTLRDSINKQVPMIIIPMISEQEFQASIVERFETGKRLSRDEVMNSNKLQLTVREILSHSEYHKQNMINLRKESENIDMAAAVNLVESFFSAK